MNKLTQEEMDRRKKLVDECFTSSLTMKDWCELNGYSTQQISAWKYKYNMHYPYRRNEKFWINTLASWSTSSSTLRSWCEKHDISYQQALFWKKRLGVVQNKVDVWVPIVKDAMESGNALEYCIRNGISRGCFEYHKRRLGYRKYHVYSDEFWIKFHSDLVNSGSKIKHYCIDNGIDPSVYFRNRKRLKRQGLI